ncbi:hypothetical protein KIK84_10330 [Curvibacter sp. CHRR-16]|uniref:hypothetical protein n=1 Tax=Curvibacter sp. CHRR-16 TaxID=2835872 RepID=UPI001BDA49FA|nr:hypothetical protein [Curvibacter sp. CHRR-16]MBT0570727.1 hypothetical protein [Curvibacter sp. CHRR-16]
MTHTPLARTSYQQGGIAPLLLLLTGATLTLLVYATAGTRLKTDAAQLKRATDAAAMAVTQAYASDKKTDVQTLAEKYVRTNLGMDAQQLQNQLSVSVERVTRDDAQGFRVSATFHTEATALERSADVTVSSAAVGLYKAVEVSLALPNTTSETSSNLAVLRRLGMRFADQLVADRNNAWIALVPYSQSVNVSPDFTDPTTRTPRGPSAAHLARLRSWTTANALRPQRLQALFRTGFSGLSDARMPDRRANLLCLFRGLHQGENYFWDSAPGAQFGVYYRHDLPENGSLGADPISWIGPDPTFGSISGALDTRFLVADRGCPAAPLLPLTNDLDKVQERLSQMSTRFNANYAIALGWSAMALAPAFRGSSGWGSTELPHDFDNEDGETVKAIVMLVNSTGQRWFDTDIYNAWGEDFPASSNQNSTVSQRFSSLCDSFKKHKVRLFMVVVGKDEIENDDLNSSGTINAASAFRRIAGSALQACAQEDSDHTYMTAFDFVASEDRIQNQMDKIVEKLRQTSNFIRLIE